MLELFPSVMPDALAPRVLSWSVQSTLLWGTLKNRMIHLGEKKKEFPYSWNGAERARRLFPNAPKDKDKALCHCNRRECRRRKLARCKNAVTFNLILNWVSMKTWTRSVRLDESFTDKHWKTARFASILFAVLNPARWRIHSRSTWGVVSRTQAKFLPWKWLK